VLNISFTHIKNFETSNVQYTDEVVSLSLGVQGLVDSSDQPAEHAVVQGLGEGAHRVQHLVLVATLGDELVTDLDLGLQQTLEQVARVHAQQEGNLLRFCLYQLNQNMALHSGTVMLFTMESNIMSLLLHLDISLIRLILSSYIRYVVFITWLKR